MPGDFGHVDCFIVAAELTCRKYIDRTMAVFRSRCPVSFYMQDDAPSQSGSGVELVDTIQIATQLSDFPSDITV